MLAFTDKVAVSNASATGDAVSLKGGRYVFSAVATWGGGTVKVQMLSGDGSTYLDVANASLTANGSLASVSVPPGMYRINIATATAVYATFVRCPE
jgi:hypothetical protein